MSEINEGLYQEAYLAFQEGKNQAARDILTRLLKSEPDNPDYWLLLSGVVENKKERLFCLQQVLHLDPQNPTARQGMVMLGQIPPQPDLMIPMQHQRFSWKAPSLLPVKTTSARQKARPLRVILQISTAIIFMAIGGMIYLHYSGKQTTIKEVQRIPPPQVAPSATYLPSSTLRYVTPTEASSEMPPLSSLLQYTYTPTPLYVQTPHPRSEAYRVAMNKMASQDYEEAIIYFQQVITNEPQAPDIQFYIGEAYRLSGDRSNAKKAYQAALDISETFAPAYYGLGILNIEASTPNYDAASDNFSRAIELDPNYIEARLALAEIALQQNDPQTVFEILEPVIDLEQVPATVHYLLGRAYYLDGDLKLAQIELELAFQQDMTILPVYRLLGEVYFQQSLYTEAIPLLEKYTHYVPDDGDALAYLGEAYFKTGDNEKALEIVNLALQTIRNNASLYYTRGLIYFAEEKIEPAIEDFKISLAINKKQFDVHMALSLAYLENGQPGNAYLQLNQAEAYIASDEQQAQLLYYRAQSLERLDEIQAAINDWKALLELPDDIMPADWKEHARLQLSLLVTPTRTPVTPTVTKTRVPTRTPTITLTRWPTRTFTITITPRPSRTPTITFTPRPSRTPTITFTPKPSQTPTPASTMKITATPTP
ncbi:MAG: tetratricopeptide repeat protein [Anaerolineaceae bacterium]